MTENAGQNDLLAELTADVVSAYVSNNSVPSSELPSLISEIHLALGKTLGGAAEEVQEKPRPAVNPKRSVTDDYIVCLEDGQKFKSLKRHLMSHYGMTPEDYREKWGLPSDYPMVAPSYAAQRSKLAREMGLGRKRGSKR
ncbi:MucR family transcriptional regulator [Oricola cellulosilytica]|uniref:Transcriptional regulator n=1 Tax=Oricola cellulosilytica TaxID=1429082 RepID=A0A4R0PF32_9HYPH|nr:MucR family transcriptional regulator [Oricola cellulosilytica]TCD14094.1 transcriptional regulator [Oricola cellulosilytica]